MFGFSLLPPPPVFLEAASFSIPGVATPFVLSLRIVPGIAFDMRREEIEERLVREYVQEDRLLHSPGQPPQPVPQDLCRYIALMMALQVQPEVTSGLQDAGRIDESALSWKPYTADQWATLAMRSEDTFWAVLALCNLLVARAEGRKALRLQVAVAYQLAMPAKDRENDLVSPERSGYDEDPPLDEAKSDSGASELGDPGNASGGQTGHESDECPAPVDVT